MPTTTTSRTDASRILAEAGIEKDWSQSPFTDPVEQAAGDEEFRATWAGPWQLPAPVGVAVASRDMVRPVRAWTPAVAPTLSHWTEIEGAGHFPALERPSALAAALRDFARHALGAASGSGEAA